MPPKEEAKPAEKSADTVQKVLKTTLTNPKRLRAWADVNDMRVKYPRAAPSSA